MRPGLPHSMVAGFPDQVSREKERQQVGVWGVGRQCQVEGMPAFMTRPQKSQRVTSLAFCSLEYHSWDRLRAQ